MSTAVMTLVQQHRPATKKMVMMLSPPLDMQPQQIQPSNGACVIVSTSGYPPASPPHFTNLDAHMSTSSTATTTIATSTTSVITPMNNNNNNNTKVKNNNMNKVNRSQGGAVQKPRPLAPGRGSVLVATSAADGNIVTSSSPSSTTTATTSAAAADALRCKRKIQFSGGSVGALPFAGHQQHQPASVARRNARERNRVKQVNNGFATLRSHIPPSIAAALQESSGSSSERSSSRSKDKDAAKKLSKVETLRMAVEYIRCLQTMLSESSNENAVPVQVKTESILSDSPNGFDADYETALALSHYSSGGGAHQDSGVHMVMSMSPPCSDASSSGSPTPSYVSDGSVGASSTGYAPHGAPAYLSRVPGHLQCRQHLDSPSTPPDSSMYDSMSAEDEELLDVISWWQQSNCVVRTGHFQDQACLQASTGPSAGLHLDSVSPTS